MHYKILISLLLLIPFLLHCKSASPQTKFSSEVYSIKTLLENLSEELPEDYDSSELEDRLLFLLKHPINLNKMEVDDLKSLVFLSPLQISNLLIHIKANGHLIDLLELQSISDFDVTTIERLIPFVTIGTGEHMEEKSYKNFLNGSHDLVIRFGRTLEKQKGFQTLTGSSYLGGPEKLLLKYKYILANRISSSLILEKDAGEQFDILGKNIFSDFKSAHLAVSNFGPLKMLVLGDYSLQFGQAVTLWSGFAFGKAAEVTSVAKNDTGLKPYTSANEYSFFRGVATSLQIWKHIKLTNFVSYRNLDASLSIHDQGIEVLSTINETGLHRTATEIRNRNTIKQLAYGAILQYQQEDFNLGAIVHHTSYDTQFTTGTSSYKKYDFTGKQLSNLGFNYNYTFKNCYFFGELSSDDNVNIATINGLLISLSSKVSAVIQYRNYSTSYHNFFTQAIAEGSKAANEKGFYFGVNINLSRKWKISYYTDNYVFPWLKFRVDAPSGGHETLGQVSYTPNKLFKASVRCKIESKQQNSDSAISINYLDEISKEAYRGELNWQLTKSIKIQNRIEFTRFKKGIMPLQLGWMYFQDLGYSPIRSKITGNIRIAFFNTSGFDSRIYAYEDDVLYNFTFGQYNGKGWRSYVNIKYKVTKKVDLWARYAIFLYLDTETVGSGLDEIQGNKKMDVKLQMRYQF